MGAKRMIINPPMLKRYIGEMRKKADDIYGSQVKVAKSYQLLGKSWQDTLYTKIGKSLMTISEVESKLYSNLCQAIDSAATFYNTYVEIQELGQDYIIKKVPLPAYKRLIREEDIMQKSLSENLITDLDAMEILMSDLKKYILAVDEIMTNVSREHRKIVDNRAWIAPQCDQMSEIVRMLEVKTGEQLYELAALGSELSQKYERIRQLYGRNS